MTTATLDKTGVLSTPAEILRLVGGSKVVGIDLETTGLDARTDRIRLLSISDGNRALVMDCFEHDIRALLPALRNVVLIAHNATFDLSFLWAAGLTDLPETICTYLVAQLLLAGSGPGGRNRKCGLAECVSTWLDKVLSKELQRSDWSGPLSSEQIEYSRQDAAILIPLFKAQAAQLEQDHLVRVSDIELRALRGFVWLGMSGVPFHRGAWEKLAHKAAGEKKRLEDELDATAPKKGAVGLFGDSTEWWNWCSPAQIKDVLGRLGIKAEIDVHGETVESTCDAVLATLDHPVVDLIRKHREQAQLVKMYGLPWLDAASLHGGRVYANWRQIGAASGRTSCERPNMQQIPRKPGYRACVKAPEGRVLIKADYGQLQLRSAAKWSMDTRMVQAYTNGEDLHMATARAITGKSEPTKADRQIAKSLNFGLVFGMSAAGLKIYAKTTYGVTLSDQEAAQHRTTFFETYKGLAKWHNETKSRHVEETRSTSGRRRLLPVNAPDTWRLNSPVQADEADGLKLALALLYERRHECPGAVPILAVHDEICLEVDTEQAEEAKSWLVRCMKDGMQPWLDPIPVDVEATVKPTWGE